MIVKAQFWVSHYYTFYLFFWCTLGLRLDQLFPFTEIEGTRWIAYPLSQLHCNLNILYIDSNYIYIYIYVSIYVYTYINILITYKRLFLKSCSTKLYPRAFLLSLFFLSYSDTCYPIAAVVTYTGFFHQVASNPSAEIPSFGNLTQPISGSNNVPYNFPESVNLQSNCPISSGGVGSIGTVVDEGLQKQDSFGTWINNIISDTPCSVDGSALVSSISSSVVVDNQPSYLPEQVFNLTEVSPTWASSTEKTKVSFCFFSYINCCYVLVAFFPTKFNT